MDKLKKLAKKDKQKKKSKTELALDVSNKKIKELEIQLQDLNEEYLNLGNVICSLDQSKCNILGKYYYKKNDLKNTYKYFKISCDNKDTSSCDSIKTFEEKVNIDSMK